MGEQYFGMKVHFKLKCSKIDLERRYGYTIQTALPIVRQWLIIIELFQQNDLVSLLKTAMIFQNTPKLADNALLYNLDVYRKCWLKLSTATTKSVIQHFIVRFEFYAIQMLLNWIWIYDINLRFVVLKTLESINISMCQCFKIFNCKYILSATYNCIIFSIRSTLLYWIW